MINATEKGNIYGQAELNTMAIGKMINKMAKVLIYSKMVQNILVIGKMINVLVEEFNLIKKMDFMMESF